jgi:hypothetical protein
MMKKEYCHKDTKTPSRREIYLKKTFVSSCLGGKNKKEENDEIFKDTLININGFNSFSCI